MKKPLVERTFPFYSWVEHCKTFWWAIRELKVSKWRFCLERESTQCFKQRRMLKDRCHCRTLFVIVDTRLSDQHTTTKSNRIDHHGWEDAVDKQAALRTASKQRNATAKEAHSLYQLLFWQSGGRQKMLWSPGYCHWCPFGNALQWLMSFCRTSLILFDWDAVHNVLCNRLIIHLEKSQLTV